VNNAYAPSTLREWGAHMIHPARAASLAGVAIVLTLLAPFETGETLQVLPRFCYWALLVVLGYSAGYIADRLGRHLLGDAARLTTRILLVGALTGLFVLIVTLVLHVGFFGAVPTGRLLIFIAANVFAISFVVAAVMQIAFVLPDTEPQVAATTSAVPRLLDRIEYAKRGALIGLSVEDHYVRVVTTNGEAMVLIRLSDAIAETAPVSGLQVHRSHWVAMDHIIEVNRQKDRARLILSNGQNIPVSRTYMPKLKEAGLLP